MSNPHVIERSCSIFCSANAVVDVDPRAVRFARVDTPNTQIVIHDYATAPLIFEVRGLPKKAGIASAGGDPALNQGGGGSGMDNYRGVDIGNVIDCEGGSLITTQYFSATAYDKAGKELTRVAPRMVSVGINPGY